MHSKPWFSRIVALVAFLFVASARAGAVTEASASTNWQTAAASLKNAGTLIGRDNYAQARAALSSASTNLAAPYNAMATDALGRLDSALKISDTNDWKRLDTLIQLCTDLRACDAAVRLQARQEKDADDSDVGAAWRLLEAGDTKAALVEYQRKLAHEEVETWQQYWKEQIHLIEQRGANQTNVPFTLELVREHYLKGYEAKGDVFSALQELTRVLPYAHGSKEQVQIHQQIIKNLDALGDEAGRTAWEEKILREFKTDPEASAGVYLDRALRAYDRKDLVEAMSLCRKICADYPQTAAYGDAQYTIALILQQQHQYDAAIAEYEKLLASKVEDYTPPGEGGGDYKCYRFRAAMGICTCYEVKGDFVKALEYTKLARDRYKYLSWCKSCMAEMTDNVALRISQLEAKVKKND